MSNNSPKILHIMNSRFQYSLNFASFVQRFFGNNHYFCPIGKLNDIEKFDSVINNSINYKFIIDKNKPIISIMNLIRLPIVLNNYDIIIWHSLFYNRLLIGYIALFKKYLNKKSIWMIWGGDLYEYKSGHHLSDKLYESFVKNLKAIISVFPGDVDSIKKIFGYSGKIYNGLYGPPSAMGFTNDKNASLNNRTDKKTIIMIGHSSAKTLNHIRVLNLLKKFNNDDIKILLPLNYGDSKYAKSVINYAKDCFENDKLIIIDSFMPLEEYLDILKSVDVCIFDTERQIALGNLIYFLKENKSIYLNKDCVMYKYWKSIGLELRTISDIECINNFEDLKFKCNNSASNYIKDMCDDDSFLELWKRIFSEIESSC